MSDDKVCTRLRTDEGWLDFQIISCTGAAAGGDGAGL
jgi:hypothetical protein